MFPDQIQQIIDHYFHEEVRTLKELVQIESVVAPWEERSGVVMPFGAGVHRAYQYMLEKGRENDFAIEDAEHYGGHIQLNHTVEERGKPEKTMGIVCHLDTVPLGNGWQHDPLSGEEDQGRLYGRGTNDDKGPAVAAFYAMKAVAECSVPRRNNVRLILGLDEETDWIGMEQYKKAVDPPDFGFTPDADFPAIHGEKGILVFELARKFERPASEGLELRKVEGGSAPNMVADRARAVIHAKSERTYHAVQELAVQESQNSPLSFRTKKTGKSMEIVCIGKSAHGAHPDLGENAITGLMAFLSQLHFANEDVNAFIAFYQKYIGHELDGASMGCRLEDDCSGVTVFNVGEIHMDLKAARLVINVRYPVSFTQEDVYRGMSPICEAYDIGIIKGKDEPPVYLDETDPLIQTLMAVYREHTGDQSSRPLVIGGGTYARAFPHVVAFGPRFPGEEDVAHQKDEYIALDALKKMTEIYADAIYQLICDVREEDVAGDGSENGTNDGIQSRIQE